MIRYALKCASDHGFESWFQSAEAFDKLAAAGLVSCATCGSLDVKKSLMAPSVRPAKTAGTPADRPLSTPDTPAQEALATLRREVEKNSEYVGLNFATEARRIHDGTAPERAIYGEAKPEEARKLIEEGVPVAPLPFLPGRKSN